MPGNSAAHRYEEPKGEPRPQTEALHREARPHKPNEKLVPIVQPHINMQTPVIAGVSLFSEFDIFLFRQGNHFRLYNRLGAHPLTVNDIPGVYFAVWAPCAQRVYVEGDFNSWNHESHPLWLRPDETGIWEGFVPFMKPGAIYKFYVVSKYGLRVEKGDPFAFSWENPPRTASRVYSLEYSWNDDEWMDARAVNNALDKPMSFYEVHLGSWRRVPEEGGRFLNYREMAVQLAEYVKDMGFTHVDLLPVMEHPFYGSWGYQTSGYFAPSSRFGTPQDFMYMVDYLHQKGIGVYLDWVPSHFPVDEHGLNYFDGTHLYEHADPQQGFHPDWSTCIFNYGRGEVREFLLSSALFWLDKYHVDGIRVDAVASMLYLDYSRKSGQWVPNRFGGRENLEAIEFLKQFNNVVYASYPDVHTMAEESTDWAMVSRPTSIGGLGFGLKWNMGWMHDTLVYMSKDPIHRKHHHQQLTFSLLYAFTENFVLPFSHDEVVHGKGSMIARMPGDEWQQFANLRLLLAYQYTHPGKKLLFMGSEFGQRREWNHDESLDWHLWKDEKHRSIAQLVRDLNRLVVNEPALHEIDFDWKGFEWIDCNDWKDSVLTFMRKGKEPGDVLVVVCNFTPVPRYDYKVGVPRPMTLKEILNSDDPVYGGSGVINGETIDSVPVEQHGHPNSVSLTLPPLGVTILKPVQEAAPEPQAHKQGAAAYPFADAPTYQPV